MFGDVGGGIGDDAGDGDNNTGLGVDACNSANDSFEGAVRNADGTTRTVVYLGIGDGVGLGQSHIDKSDEVFHIVVGDCYRGVLSGERGAINGER